MYWLLRPFLFLLSAETAHSLTMGVMKFLFRIPGFGGLMSALYTTKDQRLGREVMGIWFPNPVGLAAGMDKNASLLENWRHLGFGYIEIGTVTPKAQDGNPKPRLFRLPKDKALINRMGFNNIGMKRIAYRLSGRLNKLVVGGNIGKNKDTPNERASLDYELCFRELAPLVDFITVNVSSPNTPGLRALQGKEELAKILNRLNELNFKLMQLNRPILLKIAPDLTDEQLVDIADLVKSCNLSGVVATNTTISREGLRTNAKRVERMGAGGLSGAPVHKRSLEVVTLLRHQLGRNYAIIGVGGISSADEAVNMLKAGADLVQVYTGLVYQGPALMGRINKAVLKAGL
jgi:dihydroorotate dehydrogenase